MMERSSRRAGQGAGPGSGSDALAARAAGRDHPGAPIGSSVTFELVTIESFERFYDSHFGPMVGLAYQLTGRRDVAEDLVQEAMVRAYREWGRISSYERPDLWLRRAVLNLTTSRWRRQRTAARSWISSGRPTEEPAPSAETDAVWEQVRRLPRRQAEAVVLYYGCDLPVEEVAAIIQCSPGTVRTHLVRARAALAAHLTPEGDDR